MRMAPFLYNHGLHLKVDLGAGEVDETLWKMLEAVTVYRIS